ncbi:MAG: GTP cyclohydrolase I FolE2 [Candidimonas sp.]|nr:MAG: GTP cyclohydrolase I FolE2 [Candidimonas sp.]
MFDEAASGMPDVQSAFDSRHLAIQRVGVRGVRHPMLIAQAGQAALSTVARWELTVGLPPEEKGTHMSRFVALLEAYRTRPMTPAVLCDMAGEMLPLLKADRGEISVEFPYFMVKRAPVSGAESLLDYDLVWKVGVTRKEPPRFELSMQVPLTSLCPCSKAISNYGAHNQRSHVTAVVAFDSPAHVDVDALIRLVEQQASCELWGLLKRPDEKFVTERAYDNPKFVEDLVRDVAAHLRAVPGISRFRVQAENFESIHNHSAYAEIVG